MYIHNILIYVYIIISCDHFVFKVTFSQYVGSTEYQNKGDLLHQKLETSSCLGNYTYNVSVRGVQQSSS